MRRELSKLAGRKQRREITWTEFYREFERIVGRGPSFKHTQKRAETLGDTWRVAAEMAGVHVNLWETKRGGEWTIEQREKEDQRLKDHARERLEYLGKMREYLTLIDLIRDKQERIKEMERGEEG